MPPHSTVSNLFQFTFRVSTHTHTHQSRALVHTMNITAISNVALNPINKCYLCYAVLYGAINRLIYFPYKKVVIKQLNY